MTSPKFQLRLSDADRKLLAEIAEYHQRNTADMIRFLIRREYRQLNGATPAPRTSAPVDPEPFDIVDD